MQATSLAKAGQEQTKLIQPTCDRLFMGGVLKETANDGEASNLITTNPQLRCYAGACSSGVGFTSRQVAEAQHSAAQHSSAWHQTPMTREAGRWSRGLRSQIEALGQAFRAAGQGRFWKRADRSSAGFLPFW